MIRLVKVSVFALMLFGLTACGGVSIGGSWGGALANGSPVALNITQSTPTVAAIINISGSSFPSTGTFSNGTLILNTNAADGSISVTANVSGSTMTGNITVSVTGQAPVASTFTMTKQ